MKISQIAVTGSQICTKVINGGDGSQPFAVVLHIEECRDRHKYNKIHQKNTRKDAEAQTLQSRVKSITPLSPALRFDGSNLGLKDSTLTLLFLRAILACTSWS